MHTYNESEIVMALVFGHLPIPCLLWNSKIYVRFYKSRLRPCRRPLESDQAIFPATTYILYYIYIAESESGG